MKKIKFAALISMMAFVAMIGAIGCSSASGGGGGGGDDDSVTRTVLENAIESATALNASVTEGTAGGNASADAKTAYAAAISAAELVYGNEGATQTEINSAVSSLSTATTVFSNAIIPFAVFSSAGTFDVSRSIDNWGSGTTISDTYTLDADYDNCISVTSGTNWGPAFCVAFTNMGPGKLAEFRTLKFKVKTSSYTAIKIKVPDTDPISYALSTGTALANDWIQMTVSLSDFGTSPTTSAEFALLGDGAGSLLVTDITLSGVGSVTTAALSSAITAATTLANATTVGSANGNVTLSDKNAFLAAIAAAQTVASGTPSLQSEVTEALGDLAEAKADFLAAIIVLQPASLPAAPSLASSAVISLLNSSGTYTNIAVGNWSPGWGQGGTISDVVIDSKNIKLMQLVNYQGLNLVSDDGATLNGVLSISGKNTLHISYWTLDATALSIYPINADTEYEIPVGTLNATGEWAELEIVIDQAGFDLTTMRQFKFTGSGNFYLDNVYFH